MYSERSTAWMWRSRWYFNFLSRDRRIGGIFWITHGIPRPPPLLVSPLEVVCVVVDLNSYSFYLLKARLTTSYFVFLFLLTFLLNLLHVVYRCHFCNGNCWIDSIFAKSLCLDCSFSRPSVFESEVRTLKHNLPEFFICESSSVCCVSISRYHKCFFPQFLYPACLFNKIIECGTFSLKLNVTNGNFTYNRDRALATSRISLCYAC